MAQAVKAVTASASREYIAIATQPFGWRDRCLVFTSDGERVACEAATAPLGPHPASHYERKQARVDRYPPT